MIGAFGLPGYHHEDNDGRAIAAAKFLQKSLNELDLHSQVGISRGPVTPFTLTPIVHDFLNFDLPSLL